MWKHTAIAFSRNSIYNTCSRGRTVFTASCNFTKCLDIFLNGFEGTGGRALQSFNWSQRRIFIMDKIFALSSWIWCPISLSTTSNPVKSSDTSVVKCLLMWGIKHKINCNARDAKAKFVLVIVFNPAVFNAFAPVT